MFFFEKQQKMLIKTYFTNPLAHKMNACQASDGGSTTASTSAAVVPRKPVDTFPTTGLPLSNGPLGLGGSLSPVPCPPSNSGPAPAPSPAPAALPPPSLPYATPLQVRHIILTIKKNNNYFISSF